MDSSNFNSDSHAERPSPENLVQIVSRGGVAVPFPFKLHELLEQANHDDALAQILSWQPHGRSFSVHQPALFVEHVMPAHFSQTKFASFQRQLNLYGFVRLTKGRDRNGYYNENFLRGHPELVSKLTRQKIKGTKVRKPVEPGMEPSFYIKEFLPVPEPKPGANEGDPKLRAVVSSACLPTTVAAYSLRASASMGALPGARVSLLRSGPSTVNLASSSSMSARMRHTTPPPFPVHSTGRQLPQVTPPAPPTVDGWRAATEASSPPSLTSSTCALQPSASDQTLPSVHSTGDLLFFEGRPFHYIDKESMMKIRKPLATRPAAHDTNHLSHLHLPSMSKQDPSFQQDQAPSEDVGLDIDLWSPSKPDNTNDAFTDKDLESMLSPAI